MAWRDITETDLKVRFSGTELANWRSAALATGQADPVASAISYVSELVRGYIAGCETNQLGAGTTVPESLIGPALDILTIEIPRRVGSAVIDPGKLREKAYDQAFVILKDVAKCDFGIEKPTTPNEDATASSVLSPTYLGRDPMFGRELSDGL